MPKDETKIRSKPPQNRHSRNTSNNSNYLRYLVFHFCFSFMSDCVVFYPPSTPLYLYDLFRLTKWVSKRVNV